MRQTFTLSLALVALCATVPALPWGVDHVGLPLAEAYPGLGVLSILAAFLPSLTLAGAALWAVHRADRG